ncbi:hypothetical protein LCGC14_1035660 [marine sediment metagenome]|uniref:Uncharacterized protein n=1 Tax=marine sediment metagenome TaxID=412755 RepID=A0A0F9QBH2_9ZZZZ
MPDTPDWQRYLPGSERYALSDLGELAARLGSPLRFDRRGEVLWYDQFDHGLAPWTSASFGTGGAVKISIVDTFMSPYAALLTAGSSSLRAADLSKSIQQASLGKWGFEVAVAFLSDWDYFEIVITIRDGVDFYVATVRLSLTDNELQYSDSAGVFQKVDDLLDLTTSPPTYQILKLVFDLSTPEYSHIRLGPTEYSLSGIAMKKTAGSSSAQFWARIRLKGRAGENDTAQVGHVIFTGNEP